MRNSITAHMAKVDRADLNHTCIQLGSSCCTECEYKNQFTYIPTLNWHSNISVNVAKIRLISYQGMHGMN